MTTRVMDFETALRRRRHLREEVVCSEPWVEAMVQPADGMDHWRYLADVFPPGGPATAMRLCPTCERLAPPSVQPEPCCCDCRIEQEERVFGKWLLRRERRDLLAELGRLWWRSAVPYADLPVAVVHRRKKNRAPTNRFGGAALSTDVAPLTEAEEGCPYDTRELDGEGEGDRGGEPGESSIALEIARRRLDPPKKEAARASGCQLVLLPESKTMLMAEITYYRKHKRVMPSARRYSRHSPYLEAPEDWDTPTRLSPGVDPEATMTDAEDAIIWG
ncbi:MAG: hypothetical protein JXL80_17925 [Planctomycetes bacterium]|nr:hypothetical protein [Planctomycetota bacterium]